MTFNKERIKLSPGFSAKDHVGYLWFSQIDYNRLSSIYDQEDHWGKLENGDVVLYTDFSKEPNHQYYMPQDAILLGLGAWVCNGSLKSFLSPKSVIKLR